MADNQWLKALAIINSDLKDISEFVNDHRSFTAKDVADLNEDLEGLKQLITIAQKLAPDKHKFSISLLLKQYFRVLSKIDGLSVLKNEAFARMQWDILGDLDEMRSFLKTMK